MAHSLHGHVDRVTGSERDLHLVRLELEETAENQGLGATVTWSEWVHGRVARSGGGGRNAFAAVFWTR
jgi:hypothetical protein